MTMSIRRKIIIPLLISFLFLSVIPYLEFAKAYSSTTVTLPSNPILSYAPFRHLVMPSGKIVYAVGRDFDSNNIHVWVYSSTGTQLAYSTFNVGVGGTANFMIKAMSLYANGTDLIILGVLQYTGGGYTKVNIFGGVYDTVAYSWSEKGNVYVGIGGSIDVAFTEPYEYNDVLYAVYSINGVVADWTGYISFNLATNAVAKNPLTGTVLFNRDAIFAVQSADYRYLYLIGAKYGDASRPRYYYLDLDTDEFVIIADHPTATHWRVDTYISLRFIGGGVRQRTDNKYILYFTWGWCDDTANLEIIQHRFLFNSSGVHPDNLEDQNQRNAIFGQSGYMGNNEVSFGGGTMPNYYTIEIWRDVRTELYIGEFYTIKSILNVSAFDDFVETGLDLETPDTTTDNNGMVYEAINWRVCRRLTTTAQVSEHSDDSTVYIYWGLLPCAREYDLDLTYVPFDVPPYCNTRYLFTATLYMNDVLREGAQVYLYVDDVLQKVTVTDSNGEMSFYLLTSIAGIHNITIEVYEYEEYQDEFTEIYTFQSVSYEEETEYPVGTITIGAVMALIPMFFVIFAFPIALVAMGLGLIGFLSGLVVGAIAGFVSGILPMYGVLLLSLVIVLGFILVLKKG